MLLMLSDSWRRFSSCEAHRWKYWSTTTPHSQVKTFENLRGIGTCICGFGEPTHRVEKELWKEVIGPLRLSQLERIVQYWRRSIGSMSPQRMTFHLCTAPADSMHRYHIRIKSVDDNPLPEPEVTKGTYEKGDVVWLKNPRGTCTTKYSTGRVSEVISPQSVKIDGVPRHVKDLRPVIQTQLSSSDESDSEDSERLIYLNSDPLDSDSDASSLPTDEASVEPRTADESTHDDEACVIPLRRSTRQRRKLPPTVFVILRSRGNVGKNLTYRTCVWLRFVRFSRSKGRQKKAKMATHSRFCTCLVSRKVTQTLGYLTQMR